MAINALVVGSEYGGVLLGDITKGYIAGSIAVIGKCLSCAMSPTGEYLAVGNNSSPCLSIYDVVDGYKKIIAGTIILPGQANKMSFNADGSLLAVGHNSSPYVTVFNTGTWTKVVAASLIVDGYGGQGIAFSPDGLYLSVCHENNTGVTVFNTMDWSKKTLSFSLGGYGMDCAFSPDGGIIAVIGNGSPKLISTATWGMHPKTISASGTGTGCSFSPDGKYLAIAHSNAPNITVYSTETWTKISSSALSVAGSGKACAFSLDGKTLYVGHSEAPFFSAIEVSDWSIAPPPFPTSSAQVCIAGADVGARYIRANVRDISGDPAQRTMRVRLRSDGTRQAEVVSDPVTGDVEAKVYGGDVEYDAQFMAASGEPLNDLFFARVSSSET